MWWIKQTKDTQVILKGHVIEVNKIKKQDYKKYQRAYKHLPNSSTDNHVNNSVYHPTLAK